MQQSTPSLASSRISKVEPASIELALKSRSIVEAFSHPTVAMSVASTGYAETLIRLTAAVKTAMEEYFSAEQRLEGAMNSSFAEAIIEKYPHESLGDIPVFIKHAGWARYGDRQEDGSVTNKGKSFGRLTLTRLMDWFEQYLAEKAEEIEKVRIAENRALNGSRHDAASGISDALLSAMKKARADADKDMDDKDTGRRVGLLMRTVAHMGDARLRHAWKKARTERERMVVVQEANKRGLVQKKIEEHLSKLETPKP